MYIHRIILRDVHNFDDLDITLYDDVWQKPLNSVLLTGVNGSGKTTMLRAISALWENFGRWLHSGNSRNLLLTDAKLAAMEIRNFDLPPSKQQPLPIFDVEYLPSSIWIYMTSNEKYRDELKELVDDPGALFIGEVFEKLDPRKLDIELDIKKEGISDLYRGYPEYLNENYVSELVRQKRALEIGIEGIPLLPNMVFLEAGTRTITRSRDEVKEITPDPVYRWLVKYRVNAREQNIETTLGNMKLRNPTEFHAVLDNLNQFFGGAKEIVDFDNATRLRVRINKNQKFHPLSELSAGEQQCLIMMVMVARGLMPGGVVLIDEPDLHLHVSLQRHFIHELEKIVHARNGQLIVTSHSPEMWDEFTENQRRRLGVKEVMNG